MITIGRDASCNFVIDSPRVSGSHCQIRFMADRFEVTDLGSSNGTFVGVERTRVHAPTTVFPGQPLFLGTIEVSPTEVAGRFGLQWPAAVAAGAPRASGAGLIVVGRDGSCDFVIDSPKISGRHCQLRFAGDRVEVTDLGSSNGTFVGDERVRVQGTVVVFPGQSVFMSTVPLPIEEIARRNGVTWAAAGRPAPATVMDSQPSGAEVARLAAERAALEQERMRLEQARAVAAAPRAAAPVAAPAAAPSPVYAAQPKAASNAAGIMALIIIVGVGVGGGVYFINSAAEVVEEGVAQAAVQQQSQTEETARRVAEEERVRQEQERKAAEEAERSSIAANPGSVLEALKHGTYDEGVFNDYTQLSTITILNRSKYGLRKISGTAEWFDDSGNLVGSTPFEVGGSIPAGDTKVFSTQNGTLTSGTIKGEGKKLRLKYGPAEIVQQ